MAIQYEEGFPYYTELPDIFRTATIDDFYYNNHIIMKKPYLIHSELIPDRYWGMKTKVGFIEHNDFLAFLERGRIYVVK